MEFLNHLQPLLYGVFAAIFSYMREAFQWWLSQVLSVPWGHVGELPGSKVLLLIASAGIVAYFLFRAARELYSAGAKSLFRLRDAFEGFCQDSAAPLVRGSRRRCGSLGCKSCPIVSVADMRSQANGIASVFFDLRQRCAFGKSMR